MAIKIYVYELESCTSMQYYMHGTQALVQRLQNQPECRKYCRLVYSPKSALFRWLSLLSADNLGVALSLPAID